MNDIFWIIVWAYLGGVVSGLSLLLIGILIWGKN